MFVHEYTLLVGNIPLAIFLLLVFRCIQFGSKGVHWRPGINDNFKAFMYSVFWPLLILYEAWLVTKDVPTSIMASIVAIFVMVVVASFVIGFQKLKPRRPKTKSRTKPRIKVKIKSIKKRSDPFEVIENLDCEDHI